MNKKAAILADHKKKKKKKQSSHNKVQRIAEEFQGVIGLKEKI